MTNLSLAVRIFPCSWPAHTGQDRGWVPLFDKVVLVSIANICTYTKLDLCGLGTSDYTTRSENGTIHPIKHLQKDTLNLPNPTASGVSQKKQRGGCTRRLSSHITHHLSLNHTWQARLGARTVTCCEALQKP